jgi:hypothetical protein
MKKLLTGALALAIVAGGAARASADIVTLSPGDSFLGTISSPLPGQASCSDCSATISFALSADGLSLTVVLTNTSTDALAGINLITALGIETTPALSTGSGGTVSSIDLLGAFATGWEVTSSGGGLGGLNFDLIANTKKGTNNALDGGETGTIVFNFTSAFSLLTINSAAIHIQALSDGGSTKFGCCEEGEGSGEGEGSEGEGSGEGEGSVPEPASLLLLGIGLSGAAARMVRKNRA